MLCTLRTARDGADCGLMPTRRPPEHAAQSPLSATPEPQLQTRTERARTTRRRRRSELVALAAVLRLGDADAALVRVERDVVALEELLADDRVEALVRDEEEQVVWRSDRSTARDAHESRSPSMIWAVGAICWSGVMVKSVPPTADSVRAGGRRRTRVGERLEVLVRRLGDPRQRHVDVARRGRGLDVSRVCRAEARCRCSPGSPRGTG